VLGRQAIFLSLWLFLLVLLLKTNNIALQVSDAVVELFDQVVGLDFVLWFQEFHSGLELFADLHHLTGIVAVQE
jgi:hypothetical protein